MTRPGGELLILDWGDSPNWGDGPAAAVRPAPSPTGAYRVRVHVRGRDDAQHDGGPEEHLIAIWPSPVTGAVVWRATDDVGAYGRSVEPDEPVEFRTTPSVWNVPDWQAPPEGDPGIRTTVDATVLRSSAVDITLTAITTYDIGCRLHLGSFRPGPTVNNELGDALRTGFTGADGLRVTFRCPGFTTVTSQPGQSRLDRGPRPGGPRLSGSLYRVGGMNGGVATEHRAWLWPLPPPDRWHIEVTWPAIGLAPTQIELDGAAIVGNR
jgi:hypothetical protein